MPMQINPCPDQVFTEASMTSEPTPIEEKVDEVTTDKAIHPLKITLIALLLGLGVEILFFGHPWGVNFFLWAILCVGGLLLGSIVENVEAQRLELLLLIPIVGFAFLTFLRLEPLTVFMAVVLTLILFTLWVRTFRSDDLLRFGWIDYVVAMVWVPLESWLRPWPTIGAAGREAVGERGAGNKIWPILRGALFALPFVVIFTALLAAADLIFADYVEEALKWLNLEVLAEYTARLLLLLFSAVFLLGAMIAALRDPGERELVGEKRPILRPFIGFTETVIVLGSVNLIFLLFVIIQLAYLFGGETNITASGYTYAEYAQRGFGELVAVAFLSLGLILLFGNWGKRSNRQQTNWFNGLSAFLVGMLGVMLASAMMRLLLYEGAYGFTRLRAYTHVFIIWLGILLIAFLAVLFTGQLRRFALVTFLAVLGFGVSLSILNIDAFIVEHNTRRLWATGDIDIDYLVSLSNDATPNLVALAQHGPKDVREELIPYLACARHKLEKRRVETSWPSFHLSHNRAYQLLMGLEALDVYTVREDDYSMTAYGPGGPTYCNTYSW